MCKKERSLFSRPAQLWVLPASFQVERKLRNETREWKEIFTFYFILSVLLEFLN